MEVQRKEIIIGSLFLRLGSGWDGCGDRTGWCVMRRLGSGIFCGKELMRLRLA